MFFVVRADIMDAVGSAFHMSHEIVGWTVSSVFWGFTLGIIACALVVDLLGMKFLHILSAVGYIVGIGLILAAPKPAASAPEITSITSNSSSLMLYAGFLLAGISQGIVEGVINPLVASIYSNQKTKKLNVLHAWWPGGMIVGGLIAWAIGKAGFSWEAKVSIIFVPSVIYLVMALMNRYPQTERVESKISAVDMFKQVLNPFFLIIFGIMWITAASELGPDQWFGSIMKSIVPQLGNNAILFLVYTAGLMFVLRFFFAGLIHKFSPFVTMMVCSVLCAGGLFFLGSIGKSMTGAVPLAIIAATLFGVGKTFYWPTMLGVTSERFPKGGAFLMNLVGGAGMLSAMLALPQIGGLMDAHKDDPGMVLRIFSILPGALIVIFALISLYFKSKGGYKALSISHADEAPASEM